METVILYGNSPWAAYLTAGIQSMDFGKGNRTIVKFTPESKDILHFLNEHEDDMETLMIIGVPFNQNNEYDRSIVSDVEHKFNLPFVSRVLWVNNYGDIPSNKVIDYITTNSSKDSVIDNALEYLHAKGLTSVSEDILNALSSYYKGNIDNPVNQALMGIYNAYGFHVAQLAVNSSLVEWLSANSEIANAHARKSELYVTKKMNQTFTTRRQFGTKEVDIFTVVAENEADLIASRLMNQSDADESIVLVVTWFKNSILVKIRTSDGINATTVAQQFKENAGGQERAASVFVNLDTPISQMGSLLFK